MPDIPSYIGLLSWENKVVGTAFAIHETGLIATCYHVLAAAKAPAGIPFTFSLLNGIASIQVDVTDRFDAKHDVALLQAVEPLPSAVGAARLFNSASAKSGDTFRVIGYGRVDDPGHTYEYTSAVGKIVGPMLRDGVELLQLESKQILRGMSGAPVILDHLDGIVGIISGRYTVEPDQTWMRDTVWAAKSETLVKLDQRLALAQPAPPSEDKTVSRQTTVGFLQTGWTVQNVYQSQGDLHVNTDAKTSPGETPPDEH